MKGSGGGCIMALDAGTTSNRCIILDGDGGIRASAQREFTQHFPRPGHVEHDADEIWETMLAVAREALSRAGLRPGDIAGIGIANQRETTIVWDAETGRPIHRAIVWQDRRTADLCDDLRARGLEDVIRNRTGLVIDPYFSATKIRRILDDVPGARDRAERGLLRFGTADSWLIWKLTGGRVHATDVSNAARTMLLNIAELRWDADLLEALDIPAGILPAVLPSSHMFGETDPDLFGGPIPVAGAAGDQQAALFAQGCFRPGEAKNTYGTGGFLLMNAGRRPVIPENGLVGTVAWNVGDATDYALEGSVFVAGAAIQWLRDKLGILESAADSERLAREAPDTHGCHIVPAFAGLGAPRWNPRARGVIVGLSRGVDARHLIRATLESLAFQAHDVLEAMQDAAGLRLSSLKVDGGAAANSLLLQMQADISGIPVIRPACVESTAMGAAFLAGIAAGLWKDGADAIRAGRGAEDIFQPAISEDERGERLRGWRRAIRCAQAWTEED